MLQQPRSMISSIQEHDNRSRCSSDLQLPFAEPSAYLKNANFRRVHEELRNAGFSLSVTKRASQCARNKLEIAIGTYNPSLQQHVIPRHNYGKSRL